MLAFSFCMLILILNICLLNLGTILKNLGTVAYFSLLFCFLLCLTHAWIVLANFSF